jgi:hypothetical protein
MIGLDNTHKEKYILPTLPFLLPRSPRPIAFLLKPQYTQTLSLLAYRHTDGHFKYYTIIFDSSFLQILNVSINCNRSTRQEACTAGMDSRTS